VGVVAMLRSGVALLLVILVCGCDAVSNVKELVAQSNEAERAVEQQVGAKPRIAFNWQNGRLVTVTVQFGSVPSMGIAEVEKISREAVLAAFKQEPNNLVVAFVFPKKS